jgi:protein-tyrosine kinase
MSIVEKALQKMAQAARGAPETGASVRLEGATTAASIRPFGTVVTTAGPPRHATAPPERVVNINQTALRTAGLLAPQHQERQLAHQYRKIKRSLVSNAMGRGTQRLPNGHVIMVTSALPGEGKTFTSINLAFSMALEKDIRTLLVDADVAKQHISRLFGMEREPGLLDALQNPAMDVESLVLPTDVPGLWVLPAGTRSPNATELLASDHMREIAVTIGRNDPSRIALFDSPPLLLTTESQVLTQVVGQVVVVVRSDVTHQSVVLEALSLIEEGKPAGLVLNQCLTAESADYYGYYGEEATGKPPRPSR